MKQYIKNLLIRIVILIIIIVGLLVGTEAMLRFSKFGGNWIEEDRIINKMNNNKLQNKNEKHTDTLWLHEGEILEPKKEGMKRILVVGDSYIWGHGYSNANHIWWQQLRQMLKENGYNDVEVVAAGLNGYNTKQELENILKNKELIKQVNPDLIIIGHVDNDLEIVDENGEQVVKYMMGEDIFHNHNSKIIAKFKSLFPSIYLNVSMLLVNKFENNPFFEKNFGLGYWHWLETISSGKWLEKYENESIKPLHDYMENELKIPYFFYITNIYREPSDDNIIYLFEKYNIPYYYLPSELEKKYIKLQDDIETKINPANYHPSVYLCNLFAKMLFSILESDYEQILGNKGMYEATININDYMPYDINLNKINDFTYSFTYPSSKNKELFLSLPINKKYIKLNLEQPFRINEINISGDNIESIELFINRIDPNLNYDTQEMFSIGAKKDEFTWILDENDLITSINVSAKIKDSNSQKLIITIK